MTACVNRKHTKKVAAVVTASLVGALSLGVAPVTALAAGDGIEMQVAAEPTAFNRGDVELSGATATDGVYEVKANGDGSAINVTAVSVTPLGAGTINLPNDDYSVAIYKADSDGNPTGDAVASVVEPGRYVVVVTAEDGVYKGGKATAQLNVKAASLENLDVYEVHSDDSQDATDRSFTYTGSAIEVGFDSAGVAFTEGEDYSVKILKKGTDNVDSAQSVEVLEAGDYVAYVTGLGQYAGETKEVPFNVGTFSFAHARIVVNDVVGSDSAPTTPSKVYVGTPGDDTYAELDPTLVKLTFKSGSGTDLFDKNGKYTFTASVDKTNKNIINNADKDVPVNKVAAYATYKYDGAALESSYFVDKSKGESFDLSKIEVFNGEKKLASSTYTVTVKKGSATNAATQLNNQKPGVYTVTITVDPSKTSYEAGGSVTFTVTIVKAVVDADANVYIYHKSSQQPVSSIVKDYDGTPIEADHYEAKAFDKDGNQIADNSLTVKLYDEDGKQVSTVVDAGNYTMKVESTKLQLTGTTEIPVTINKATLADVVISGGTKSTSFDAKQANYDYVAWTQAGTSVSDLTVTYSKDTDGDGELEDGQTLPSGVFNITITKDGKKVDKTTDEVVYALHFEPANDAAANNYNVPADIEFTVVKDGTDCSVDHTMFIDVTYADYYADPVAAVADADYMNGYSNSDLFGSEDTLTRGQVACILFNMAQAAPSYNENGMIYVDGFGWKSFDDVDGGQYYGKAIAWAKQNGVVNGYGDGTFKPDAPVTREEFAAMLANYAKKFDASYETADASALDSFGDAGQVSVWATDVVAWAVENDVMGNGGFLAPTADIIRADAACMVYNYAIAE